MKGPPYLWFSFPRLCPGHCSSPAHPPTGQARSKVNYQRSSPTESAKKVWATNISLYSPFKMQASVSPLPTLPPPAPSPPASQKFFFLASASLHGQLDVLNKELESKNTAAQRVKTAEHRFVAQHLITQTLCNQSGMNIGILLSQKLKSRSGARSRFQEPSLELSSQAT